MIIKARITAFVGVSGVCNHRLFSTASHLPPKAAWKKDFNFVGTKLRGRDTISCLDTARRFVKEMGVHKMGSKDTPVTVVDAYSGVYVCGVLQVA